MKRSIAASETYSNTDGTRLRRLVVGLPPQGPGFEPSSDNVRFVVDKSVLGHVFSGYFSFPCQSLTPPIGLQSSSGVGNSGLDSIPSQEVKK
jgi:hypothetical protein